jgi:hypothetical protein
MALHDGQEGGHSNRPCWRINKKKSEAAREGAEGGREERRRRRRRRALTAAIADPLEGDTCGQSHR